MTSETESREPLRVLFLCTGNSARSQIAEALLTSKGNGRFEAGSAGVSPKSSVHPDAVEILHEHGIDWRDRRPKTIEEIWDEPWDFVITVCDNARESCPTFPGQPTFAHWGMPDPSEVEDESERKKAFLETLRLLRTRIDLLLALPLEKLEPHSARDRLHSIAATDDSGSQSATR